MTHLSTVKPQKMAWLWPGYIPRGKLTLLLGDPGVGKSYVTHDIAARVTTGKAWPDGAPASPAGDVILLQAEDDLADTIRPRFDSLGGDPARVLVIKAARDNGPERMFNLTKDVEKLRGLLSEVKNVRLIIIDPLMAYLDERTDSYKDTDVRRALTPLVQLAADTGVAVLAVMHLNKKQDTQALYRAGGSIGFIAVARMALVINPDPRDANRRTLKPLKTNLKTTVNAQELAFHISETLEWDFWDGNMEPRFSEEVGADT